MRDRHNNIIKVGNKLTNGKDTGKIENICGVTMLVIYGEDDHLKRTIVFSKLNLDEWELVK